MNNKICEMSKAKKNMPLTDRYACLLQCKQCGEKLPVTDSDIPKQRHHVPNLSKKQEPRKNGAFDFHQKHAVL